MFFDGKIWVFPDMHNWEYSCKLYFDTAQLKTFKLNDDNNDQLLLLELGCSHSLSPLLGVLEALKNLVKSGSTQQAMDQI